jgi:hypothetical protein
MQVWGAYLFFGSRVPVYLNITAVGKNHDVFDYLPTWRRPRLAWLLRIKVKH